MLFILVSFPLPAQGGTNKIFLGERGRGKRGNGEIYTNYTDVFFGVEVSVACEIMCRGEGKVWVLLHLFPSYTYLFLYELD